MTSAKKQQILCAVKKENEGKENMAMLLLGNAVKCNLVSKGVFHTT
jgi:hypothetical protein